jgi:ParB-like chromosome segregation protein Spo0J
LVTDLTKEIHEISDINERIDTVNHVRMMIHEVSPFKHHPVDFVEWRKIETIKGNDYNPNKVAPPEYKLLKKSIEEDGFTMPCPTFPKSEGITEIVDGFHRSSMLKFSTKINDSTLGRLPITYIRKSQESKGNRIASTIRHNRARGEHNLKLMQNIIKELVDAGMSDAWILKHIGMDADELLRLKQLSGLAELFKNKEFSNSWT